MDTRAPKPTRSRKEEYRAKVRAERTTLPFVFFDVLVRGVPMLVVFGGAGVLLFRKGHHVGGALVCLASIIALAFVARTYFKEATRRPGAPTVVASGARLAAALASPR